MLDPYSLDFKSQNRQPSLSYNDNAIGRDQQFQILPKAVNTNSRKVLRSKIDSYHHQKPY